jgi:hypothetical protein
MKTDEKTLHVGAKVQVRFGPNRLHGVIVEDQGLLAAGRRLWRVKYIVDGTEERFSEMTEDELTLLK